MIDAQSPARLDAMNGQSMSLWAGVIRPQDTLQMNILAEMTRAMNAATLSPLTGRRWRPRSTPVTALISTRHFELDWYLGVLDGGSFLNSGKGR